jgi:hypothetical protein
MLYHEYYRPAPLKASALLRMGMKAAFLLWSWDARLIGRIVPRQVGIESPADEFGNGQILGLAALFELLFLSFGNVDIGAFFAHRLPPQSLDIQPYKTVYLV